MNEQAIVSKMHEYLHSATKELCAWLGKMLPRVGEDWWQVCVLDNLSFVQRQYAGENGYSKLEDFDLAALLRVADKSWYDMRSFAFLPTRDRQCVRDMMKVRNNWAHLSGAIADKDVVLRDVDTILSFFIQTSSIQQLCHLIAGYYYTRQICMIRSVILVDIGTVRLRK